MKIWKIIALGFVFASQNVVQGIDLPQDENSLNTQPESPQELVFLRNYYTKTQNEIDFLRRQNDLIIQRVWYIERVAGFFTYLFIMVIMAEYLKKQSSLTDT